MLRLHLVWPCSCLSHRKMRLFCSQDKIGLSAGLRRKPEAVQEGAVGAAIYDLRRLQTELGNKRMWPNKRRPRHLAKPLGCRRRLSPKLRCEPSFWEDHGKQAAGSAGFLSVDSLNPSQGSTHELGLHGGSRNQRSLPVSQLRCEMGPHLLWDCTSSFDEDT